MKTKKHHIKLEDQTCPICRQEPAWKPMYEISDPVPETSKLRSKLNLV